MSAKFVLRGLLAGVCCTLCSTLLATTAQADSALEIGWTDQDSVSARLTLDRQYSLAQWHPDLSLRLAGGLLLLPALGDDDNAALIAAPALRYQWSAHAHRPFVEFGIGAALFVDTQLDEHSLSTSFQFEDRLAAGMALGRGEVSLSLSHYSNAGIKRPNDGLNIAALGYRLRL